MTLTAEEKLVALNIPLEIRQTLTLEDGEMIFRKTPSEWPDELQRKLGPFITAENGVFIRYFT